MLFLLMIVYISSRVAWEANVAVIRKHNLEHDLGLHSYTLGLNKYADLVSYQDCFKIKNC